MSDVTYKTRGESLQNTTALEIARDRIAQLEREIKNKAETIEQLQANNATFAADALAMATVRGIVFGTDADARSNDELYRAIRELQAKAATSADMVTLAAVYEVVFGYEADDRLDEDLLIAIRDMQIKSEMLDQLEAAFVEREACFSAKNGDGNLLTVHFNDGYLVDKADKHLLTTERVESFTAALDALLGEEAQS